ncbi:MAG TPA: glycosyltransferase family 2 protein [Nitrospirae bacterium]|nr:glycosyltransferase family 2 protein [Nitrospirota bacterium]
MMMNTRFDFIVFSVVIVNYNGKAFLENCVRSILNNTYDNYEIIIVDNASTDGSINNIYKKFTHELQKIKIVTLEENYGPARARNEGVKVSQGKYVGFLDNDTEVHKDWIIEAAKDFDRNRELGIIQCKLLFLKEPNKIDCVGEFLGPNGFLIQRAKYKEIDEGQYDEKVELLAAKSAGMFIRKDTFNKIGGFDDDFFIYMEETDLCWRSWLAGYKTAFCSTSLIYHRYSTTLDIVDKNRTNYLIRFHGTKNYILTLIKNLGSLQLILVLPKHLIIWNGFILLLIVRGNFRSALNVMRGILWNLVHLPETLKKRSYIQSRRLLSDRMLLEIVMKKESITTKIRQFLASQKQTKTPENS